MSFLGLSSISAKDQKPLHFIWLHQALLTGGKLKGPEPLPNSQASHIQ